MIETTPKIRAVTPYGEANRYQLDALRTLGEGLTDEQILDNAALGLTGESGENLELILGSIAAVSASKFADGIKKMIYHGHDANKEARVKELGDILWYVAIAAHGLGVPLSEVMDKNIAKLLARYPEGWSQQASINRAE